MPRGVCSDPEKEAARARKISEARKSKYAEQGFLNTPDTKRKISAAQRGRSLPEEHKQNISAALKGRLPKNHAEMLAKAHATPSKRGEESPNWLGDGAGYSALHMWIRKVRGTPRRCEECGTIKAKQYEWANLSGEYRRDPNDWKRMCVLCHRRMDRARAVKNGWVPWNKGKGG